MFDRIARAVLNNAEVVALSGENFSEVVSVVNKNRHAVKSDASMEIVQKPPRSLFVCRGKQPDMDEFVRDRINRTVHPVLESIELGHLFVESELIRCYRRERLEVCAMHPIVNRDATPRNT